MPLYEYRCKPCGHRFEKIQSFSAPDEKECPVCRGEVERLISAPAVQFKGSGFYSTDYASKPAAKSTDSGKGDGVSNTGESGKPAASGDNGVKPSSGSSTSTAPAAASSNKE